MLNPATFDVLELEYRIVRARNRLRFALAPKGDRAARRIFVVGHPRTGTGTLHRIFLANGLDSVHTAGSWKTDRHECFSDRGNYQPVERLAETYPKAEFVLNTRPAWRYLRSRMNQTTKKRTRRGLPQPRFSARNAANEIRRRNAFFVDCLRLFDALGERFVIANIERAGAFEFICGWLGLEHQPIWHNKTPPEVAPETAERLDAGFRLLGVEDERMNPFVFEALLEREDRDRLARFMDQYRARIFL